MSFRTDQWYNLDDYSVTGEDLNTSGTPGKSGYNVPGADNKDFVYPSRLIRTGTNTALTKANSEDKLATRNVQSLKRGYIRSLTTAENKLELPDRKCQFQFNPQFLVQSVSQNTAILNFLQQDPAQYAQPIPGNVSFSFELFFDRSMELNNPDRNISAPDETSPWERSDPSYIGVLHDISAFYSVIGVGLSDAMGQYAQKVLENQVQNEIADRLLDAGDGETTFDADAEYASATQSINDLLKYNMGNTAFLLPLPVRVVFSSLYIVEGLVKDVTVTFTKFNAAMVPMQCTLNVLFEAKYIGFAKRDTFFTNVLTEAEDTDYTKYKNTNTATPPEVAEYTTALSKDLDLLTVFPVKQATWEEPQKYMPVAFTEDGAFLYNLVSHKGKQKLEDNYRNLYITFPRSGAYLANLAQDGSKSITASVSGTCELWRYDESFAEENPELTLALQTSLASPSSLIGPYDDATKSQCRRLLSALRKWKDTADSNSVQLTDADGSLARFQRVQRVWTMHLTSDTAAIVKGGPGVFGTGWLAGDGMEYKNTANGVTELLEMFDTGIMTRSMVPPKYDTIGGHYDRSLSLSTGGGDTYPDHDNFRYIAEYKITVLITIDANTYEKTALDYVHIPVYGIGDNPNKTDGYTLIKSLSFDWGSEYLDALEQQAAQAAAEGVIT